MPTIEQTHPAPGYGTYDDYGSSSQNPEVSVTNVPLEMLPGMAYFRDNLATADKFEVSFEAEQPPTNQIYQGWLITEDGEFINTGILEIQDDGMIHLEWTAPDSRNLIASVIGFQVTLEQAPGRDQPAGKVAYTGQMADDQVALARSLFVSNTGEPATPRNKALALALVQQTDLAEDHIKNAINAEAIGALGERSLHLEHVINILEGAKGERFKDYNGDGKAENPGDGFGVMAYVSTLATRLNRNAVTAKARETQSSLLKIEQEITAIIEDRPGAEPLSELLSHFAASHSLVAELYSLSEQAAVFKVSPVTTP